MSELLSRPFTVWLTGLTGAGKTTVAGLVSSELERRGVLVDWLDGDAVRQHLSADLGFSKADRDTNIARISWIASRLTRAGAAVVVSAISPFAEARKRARELIEPYGAFVEVYVAASVEVCARRDVKGLYERALRNELADFAGVTAPYEQPANPEVRLDTEHETPTESAAIVLGYLERAGLV
jgi:adenylyl-sulfate kinase